MTIAERVLERALAVDGEMLVCPRRGSVRVTACDGCPLFCRTETQPASVICSYPIPARETLARRSRYDEGMRIALRHWLERT